MVSAKDLIEKIKDCDGSGFKMEEISIRKVGANFRMLAQNLHAESRKNLIYFIEHIIRKSNTLSWKKPIRKDIEYSVLIKTRGAGFFARVFSLMESGLLELMLQ